MDYFYEVCTRYGIAGYYTSLESVSDIFDSRYPDVKRLVKKYKYDANAGGGRVWTFFYQDSSASSAFSSNNRDEVLKVYSQFAEIGQVSGDNILNSYTLNELPSDVQLILDSVKYQSDNEPVADSEAETAETAATETETAATEDETAATEAETAATEDETAATEAETAATEDETAATEAETAATEAETAETAAFIIVEKNDAAALSDSQISVLTDALNGEPVNGEPVNGEPVNGEPVNGEPVNGEPVNGEPVDLSEQFS